MVRCYDCGKKIAEEEIMRADICTGYSRSYRSLNDFLFGKRSYFRKANLCPFCFANRKQSLIKGTKTLFHGIGKIFGFIIVALLVLLLLGMLKR